MLKKEIQAQIKERKRTGGSAFPTVRDADGGLTVRDYFAIHGPNPHGSIRDIQVMAKLRYGFADAMLAAREKK